MARTGFYGTEGRVVNVLYDMLLPIKAECLEDIRTPEQSEVMDADFWQAESELARWLTKCRQRQC